MNHKELDAMPDGRQVWKSSMLLAEMVYKQTTDFPKHEQFGITSQIRRAAVSVPANTCLPAGRSLKGFARKGNKEFIQFLYIALGSLSELETLFLISEKIGYIDNEQKDEVLILITDCLKLIHGLIKYLKANTNPTNN